MGSVIQFEVYGIPVAQGSKRAFNNRVVDANSTQLRPWRDSVTAMAMETKRRMDQETFLGPVRIDLTFTFPRPKYHYGTGRNAGKLKPTAPTFVTTKPDLDKLIRAVFDALTVASIWRDDSQVVVEQSTKIYGDEPGVSVLVQGILDDD